MTLYHFANCLALAYTPYYLTYKYTGLAEYGAFWKVGQAGVMYMLTQLAKIILFSVGQAGMMYMLTQLAKMIFLATFIPMQEVEDEESFQKFDLVHDVFRATVDIADLIGIYFVMQRVAGKGSVKILVAGLGWAMAELVLTRLVFLWVGARGVEFDWRYIQKSLDANISLVYFLSLAALVWIWTRKDHNMSSKFTGVLTVVLGVACYKGVLVSAASHYLQLGTWAALAQDGIVSSCLGLLALQMFIAASPNEKYS